VTCCGDPVDEIIIACFIIVITIGSIGVQAIPDQAVIGLYDIEDGGVGRVAGAFEAVGFQDLQVVRLVGLAFACRKSFLAGASPLFRRRWSSYRCYY